MAYTPASCLDDVRAQFNELTANATFLTENEIHTWQWEAENHLCSIIGYIEATTTHSTVTDTSEYTLPDNCLKIARVSYSGKRLKHMDDRDIELQEGTSAGSSRGTGEPKGYRIWGGMCKVSPVPDAATSLAFEFFKGASMVATASTLFTLSDTVIQQMIPSYCLWRASLKDKDYDNADRYQQEWEHNLQRAHSIREDKHSYDRIQGVKDEDEYAGGEIGMD